MQIKKSLMIAALAALLLVPFASAGFFDFITGRGTSGDVNVTAQVVSDTAPVVTAVIFNDSFDLAEGSEKTFNINVTVYDVDGSSDISTAYVNVSNTCDSEPRNRNAVCTPIAGETGDSEMNYTCDVIIMYWDCDGYWLVNATGVDNEEKSNSNDTLTVNVGSLPSLEIYPLAINFGDLNVSDTNKQSLVDNTLNNTGNFDFTAIEVNSTDLNGTKSGITGFVFPANNFTALTAYSSPYPCSSGYQLTAGSSVTASGDSPKRRKETDISQQSATLSYCIPLVPQLPAQIYNTDTQGPWTIKAS